jgi:ribA/ribD-fused uncharacterized protein
MNEIKDFRFENRYLSNFHLVTVQLDGAAYASTEHAYQAAKYLDPKRREIFTLEFNPNLSPAGAKKLGQLKGIREDWDAVKVSVMRELLLQKFKQPELGAKLLATGDAYLEEGNYWHDVFWGVCYHKMDGHTCKKPEHEAFGENNLGKLLMEVRAVL